MLCEVKQLTVENVRPNMDKLPIFRWKLAVLRIVFVLVCSFEKGQTRQYWSELPGAENDVRENIIALENVLDEQSNKLAVGGFQKSAETLELYVKSLAALDKGLDFMWNNRDEINLDGVIGIRMVEGELRIMYS